MPVHEVWQALAAEPLRFVDPVAVRACLDDAVSVADTRALIDLLRFQPRLLARLHGVHGLAPLTKVLPNDSPDLDVVLLDARQLASLPLVCGALWHALALSREIRRDAVQQLRHQLGDEVFAFAISKRDKTVATDCLLEGERLRAAIEYDGQVCTKAWLHTRPEPLRRWLTLRWPAWIDSFEEDPVARLDCLYRAARWLHESEVKA